MEPEVEPPIITDLPAQRSPQGFCRATTLFVVFSLTSCVIVFHLLSDDPVMSRPADNGFSDSIKKPYHLEDLAGMLDKHLSK